MPLCTTPNLLDHGRQDSTVTACKRISKLSLGRPATSLNHGPQVSLHTCSIIVSQSISHHARSWPPTLHYHGLQLYVQTRIIVASKLAQSQPPTASSKPVDYCLPVCMIMTTKLIPRVAWLRPPKSHNHSLQVLLHTWLIMASKFTLSWSPSVPLPTRSITTSKYISNLPRLQLPSPSTHLLDHNLRVNYYVQLITSSECISKYTLLPPANASA